MGVSAGKLIVYVVVCTLLLPIVYAVIPLWLIRVGDDLGVFGVSFSGQRIIGAMITFVGLAALPYCSTIFFRYGKRTPLFTETSGNFFKEGIYGKTRNPIYIGHILVGLGIFIWHGSLLLLAYTVIGWIILHMYLVFIEEPQLRERYGEDYEKYVSLVPRWL